MRGRQNRLLVVVVLIFVILVGVSALLNAYGERLGPGRVQRANPLDDKIDLAWRLHYQKVPLDVLIIGNSTVDSGLDPDIIAEHSSLPLSSFNGALPGYDYEVHRPCLHRIYDPLIPAPIVVLGVSMMDANRNEKGFRENVKALSGSHLWPLYLQDGSFNLESWLFRHFPLYRYGLSIQRILREYLGTERRLHPRGISRGIGTEGSSAPLRETALAHFQSFSVGGPSFDSLSSLLKELQIAGRKRIVINMPLSPRLFSEVQGFRANYQNYQKALFKLATTTDTRYVDSQENLALPRDAFADEYHVNEKGRQALSDLVAKEMGKEGYIRFIQFEHP